MPYLTVVLVDVKTGAYELVKSYPKFLQACEGVSDAPTYFEKMMAFLPPLYLKECRAFNKLGTLSERLRDRDDIYVDCQAYLDKLTWVRAYWRVVKRNEAGEVEQALYQVQNIEKQKAEMQLSEKRKNELEELQTIIATSRVGTWRIELRPELAPRLYCDAKMKELLGLSPDVLLSPEGLYQAWYTNISIESLPSVQKSVGVMLQGKIDENTYRWIHPTLGRRFVRCGGYWKKEGDSDVLRGYHVDITDQFTEERNNQFIVQSVAKTLNYLYLVNCANDTYVTYNAGAEHIQHLIPHTGPAQATFDLMCNQIVHPDFRNVMREFTDLSTLEARLKENPIIFKECLSVNNIWISTQFVLASYSPNGSLSHVVFTIRDIDKRKRKTMEQAQALMANVEANKAKTLFLQNMSHEIRTPLNALFGYAQLLGMPDGSWEENEKQEFNNFIVNSYYMLTMLIDDILDIADAEHGNYRILIDKMRVNDVCRQALQTTEFRKPATVRMYFTSDFDDSFTIQSDARRIQQVLVNYLTNACKHTQIGEIHLHCSQTENPGKVTFSVTDTGSGVKPELKDKIFERFMKVDNFVQGSGLGLHICRTVAEKLNGVVDLDLSYTDGARFVFIL